MLQFLLRIVIIVAVIVGLAAAWGASLPREHVAASRVVIAQPIDRVFEVVRNPAALLDTWQDLTRAEPVAGVEEEVWDQTVDGFAMRIIVSEVYSPYLMVTTIDAAPDAAFGGTWTYELVEVAGGTQVTVTESGWIANSLYRVMGRLFGMHTSLDGYLEALGLHFTEAVRSEHVGQP